MVIIGTFTRTENGYAGSIRTPILSVKSVDFVPAVNLSENGPDYRVFASTVELGAAWKQQASNGITSLTVSLDDPSFAFPIYSNLVDTEGDEFNLVWSRAHPPG
ncbi:DUF736 family protein [Rhizobium leguminosarum]|nr:DUF736 domain-containing protein [Rhizobium leguminosarum]NEI59449.1 DUF736 family protein [Rhizobium leguminosarum]NEI88289.1 DUF736 family protein [Rhizobium leguminosarum]